MRHRGFHFVFERARYYMVFPSHERLESGLGDIRRIIFLALCRA
jgi:hypothetical protein